MPRRAFTLVELLVVIAIMITLMGLIMGGVMLAKRVAMRAKAVSLIGAVAAAIDQYRSLNNVWPERKVYSTTVTPAMPTMPGINDGDEVYGKVFGPSPAKAATAVTADEWQAVNMMLAYQLADFAKDSIKNDQFIDPWKKPLRYRPSKWYPYATALIPRVDSENPPGQDSYQLWSSGPDATQDPTDPGEGGDDIPQWTKK